MEGKLFPIRNSDIKTSLKMKIMSFFNTRNLLQLKIPSLSQMETTVLTSK